MNKIIYNLKQLKRDFKRNRDFLAFKMWCFRNNQLPYKKGVLELYLKTTQETSVKPKVDLNRFFEIIRAVR